MNNLYIDFLKNEILKQESIHEDALLKGGQWNKSSYKKLSEKLFYFLDSHLSDQLRQQLGVSISPRTLYNLFEHKRPLVNPLDSRAIKTLDKLCIFAQHKNWSALINAFMENSSHNSGQDDSQEIKKLLFQAKEEEYQCYRNIPAVTLENLEQHYTRESSALAEIKLDLAERIDANLVLSNNFNPSSYEILRIDIEDHTFDENAKIVQTEEYWLLCWYSLDEKKYKIREKQLKQHKYVFKKVKDSWRIHVNASN